MYYKKLNLYFKSKGLKQKEVADIMEHNPTMISRYLNGTSDFSADFIRKLTEKFPDIDLNEIFSVKSNSSMLLEEPGESYNFNVVKEIEEVEKRLSRIKSELENSK